MSESTLDWTEAIEEGPTPQDSGDVMFLVRTPHRTLEVFASPVGVGVRQDGDEDAVNAATRAVHRYVDQHREAMLPLYRKAAGLRRAAGNPPPFEPNTRPEVRLRGEPTRRGSLVHVEIAGLPVTLEVTIFDSGGVMDHCDDWPALNDADRLAGIGAALDYLFANPEPMQALGVDVELFAELYR